MIDLNDKALAGGVVVAHDPEPLAVLVVGDQSVVEVLSRKVPDHYAIWCEHAARDSNLGNSASSTSHNQPATQFADAIAVVRVAACKPADQQPDVIRFKRIEP